MTRAALLAAALAAELSPAAGEPPRAYPVSLLARAERSEVRLGEPFEYAIEVVHPAGERVTIAPGLDAPPFRGTGGGCRRAEQGAEARTTCVLRLALFALGTHEVPELRLAVLTPQGEATLAVPGPRVTAAGIIDPAAPAGSLALRDLAPPVPLLVPSLRAVWWTLAAAALALAALVARRLWRRRRRAAAAPAPPEPPDVRLARRLDALEAKALPARGLGGEHLAELSLAVREWIGAVAGVNALELTTAELLERLGRAGPPRLDLAALRRFCEASDLVKFARAPADPASCASATRWARELPASIPTSTSSRGGPP